MNFFHRPRTPALQLRNPTQPHVESTSHSTRPKFATRTTNDKNEKNTSKDKYTLVTCEDEAVKPFDYMLAEDHDLYVGAWKPLQTMDAIHGRLLSAMGEDLPVRFNGGLCRIFEDYRRLYVEHAKLTAKDSAAEEVIQDLRKEHAQEKELWQHDEADYIKEIKRLETIIAHSNHGVEGVIKARRESIIRKKKENWKYAAFRLGTAKRPQEEARSVVTRMTSQRDINLTPRKHTQSVEKLYDSSDEEPGQASQRVNERNEMRLHPQSAPISTDRHRRPYSFLHGDELEFRHTKTSRHRPRSSSLSQVMPTDQEPSPPTPGGAAGMRQRPSSVNTVRSVRSMHGEQIRKLGRKFSNIDSEHYASGTGGSNAIDQFHSTPTPNRLCSDNPAAPHNHDDKLSVTECSGVSIGRYATSTSPMAMATSKHDLDAKGERATSCSAGSSPAAATAAARAAVTSSGRHAGRIAQLEGTKKCEDGTKARGRKKAREVDKPPS